MLASFLRRRAPWLSTFAVRVVANLYGPFLGAGIRIKNVSADYRYIRVELPLRWYNANYVGTHFGGSIYAMTDPFYMLMFIQNLGREYVVWDRAARIEFLKPGRRRLVVEFAIAQVDLDQVRAATADGQKYVFDKEVLVHDDQGVLVARVIKTLHVRKKNLISSS